MHDYDGVYSTHQPLLRRLPCTPWQTWGSSTVWSRACAREQPTKANNSRRGRHRRRQVSACSCSSAGMTSCRPSTCTRRCSWRCRSRRCLVGRGAVLLPSWSSLSVVSPSVWPRLLRWRWCCWCWPVDSPLRRPRSRNQAARCYGDSALSGWRRPGFNTKFTKLPSRARLQTACEQRSLWLIECSLKN